MGNFRNAMLPSTGTMPSSNLASGSFLQPQTTASAPASSALAPGGQDQAAIEKDLEARRIGQQKLKAMIDAGNMSAYDMARQRTRGNRVLYGDRSPRGRGPFRRDSNLVLTQEIPSLPMINDGMERATTQDRGLRF